ncbi:MAG: hypothetical protein NW200_04770 [Hyphomonadaceae bacterium]|nr:hypothetical protein [Hyphomonadaceae bacterium]
MKSTETMIGAAVLSALAIVVAVALLPAPAWAQAAGLPVREVATGAVDFFWPIVTAGALWLVRRIPSQLAWVLTAGRVEQLLAAARTYAINAIPGASHDRPFTLPVGNEVARVMVEFSLAHAPTLVQLFGLTRWREKVIARLQFEADVSVPAPVPATK